MKRAVNQQLWDSWRERLGQQAASGLTITAFCKQHGLSLGSFYQWKRKLNAKDAPPTQGTLTAATPAPATTQRHEPAFLRLDLPSAAPTAQWIELVLASGTLIRLPAHNVAVLETVLRSVGGSL